MKYSKETSTLLQDAGLDAKNVGSSEAQIALLTDRIRSLTEHVLSLIHISEPTRLR